MDCCREEEHQEVEKKIELEDDILHVSYILKVRLNIQIPPFFLWHRFL